MNELDTTLKTPGRFYKLNLAGRWHKKSPRGLYEEVKSRDAIKRLNILSSKSMKRVE